MNSKPIFFIGSFALISYIIFITKNPLLGLTCLLGIWMVCLFGKYEQKGIVIDQIVLVAILSSWAFFGRVFFRFTGNVQAASFIIIVTSLMFGKQIGVLTAITSTLSSNFLLGHGLFTVWQMALWVTMASVTAYGRKFFNQHFSILLLYSFLWGFIFGWIMNVWHLLAMGDELSFKAFIGFCILSFPFDLSHALSNFFFVCFGARKLQKILGRVDVKYGISKNETQK